MNPFVTSIGCISEENELGGLRMLTYTQSDNWDSILDACIDDDEFIDAKGLGCAVWNMRNLRNRNCRNIENKFDYTSSQANEIRLACKVACGTCTTDENLIHSIGLPDDYDKTKPYPLFLY